MTRSEIFLNQLEFFVHQLRALMVFIQQSRVVPHDQPTHERDQRHQETVSVSRGTHVHAPPEDRGGHFAYPENEGLDKDSVPVPQPEHGDYSQRQAPVILNVAHPVLHHHVDPRPTEEWVFLDYQDSESAEQCPVNRPLDWKSVQQNVGFEVVEYQLGVQKPASQPGSGHQDSTNPKMERIRWMPGFHLPRIRNENNWKKQNREHECQNVIHHG